MSLHNTDIQGNANISRNANIGGNLKANGDMSVGHNLIVKGWLEAPNIKGPLKGLYASEATLKAAYPDPEPGWYALIGNTLPAEVWRVDNGDWAPTGETGGEFTLWPDQIEADINALGERIDEEAQTRTEDIGKIQGVIELEELDNMYGPGLPFKKAAMNGEGPFRFIVTKEGRNVGDVDVIGDGMGHNLTQILTTHYVAPDFSTHTDDRVHVYIRTYVLSKGSLTEPIGTWTEWREPYADLKEMVDDIQSVIEFDDLDDMHGSNFIEKKAAVKGPGPFRFIVTKNGYNMGVADVISDNMGHTLTQILTTHSNLGFASHSDERIRILYRSCKLAAGTLEGKLGSWTEWKELTPELTQDTGDSSEKVMSQKAVTNAIKTALDSMFVEVSEDEMEELISSGAFEKDRIYYTVEEE